MNQDYYGKAPFGKYLKKKYPQIPIKILTTQLYFLVCIPFRFALFSIIYIFRRERYTPWIVGIIALLTIINLGMHSLNEGQWWSRKFLLIISILLVITCTITIINPNEYTRLLTCALLYLSLFGGIGQRLYYMV